MKTGGQLLKQGMQGHAVAEFQKLLGVKADGKFGAGTKKAVVDLSRHAEQLDRGQRALGL
ncbi:hypothetical protein [Archangium sp.]|uniref:peptidoglycan-binding domain-containing protein n=1 Tax=Archangium sp. TaxID=1872627 RepID=UPI00286AB474|nr:hypothetical protein [Archangium sp.]